ncbi:MAG: DUF488 domain-containing protein [Sedimentisphaerales bacterium]|nr:DUF488 domain-containing protein [Sedimentisphaerales bacterium]
MKAYTVGYGGRKPDEFISLLKEKGVKAIVDVRLRPEHSSMGTYARTKDPQKGIQRLLGDAGIQYFSFVELGNVFLEFDDWESRYRRLMDQAADILLERLLRVPTPFCLMCAEKSAVRCHRKNIADYLAATGYEVEHIE